MISIVIPTFNRAQYLPVVFESYLKQRHVKEVIFVDDGSTHDTREVLQALQSQDDKIKVIHHEKNKGLPASRNTGVEHSSGEYIMFGEDDLWLCDRHCETLLDHLQVGGYDIIAGRLINVPDLGEPEITLAERKAEKFDGPLIDYSRLVGNFHKGIGEDVRVPFLHACALLKREVFQDLKYDERSYKVTYFREETDFYLRAAAHGFKMAYCPHTKSYHLGRRALGGDEPNQGGCGAKTGIVDKFWNQMNNLVFVWKNRHALRDIGVDYRLFAFRFFRAGVGNTIRLWG